MLRRYIIDLPNGREKAVIVDIDTGEKVDEYIYPTEYIHGTEPVKIIEDKEAYWDRIHKLDRVLRKWKRKGLPPLTMQRHRYIYDLLFCMGKSRKALIHKG